MTVDLRNARGGVALKPCPICRGPVSHGSYSAYSVDSSFSAITCERCGLYFTAGIWADHAGAEYERAEKWNRQD